MSSSPWLVIHARSPSEELNALLAEGLIASGALAVHEEGPWLCTWLGPSPDPAAAAAAVRARLESIAAGQRIEMRWELKPDEDWLVKWREGLAPRRVGRRIMVAPSWTSPERADGDILIVIDPQMAFGTGEHASTRCVLRLLEDAVRPGARVLDAGAGSGVLAIAAALLGAAHVDAVEVDGEAVDNARENVTRNACEDRVRLNVDVVDDAFLRAQPAAWDVIAANILSSVLVPLLPAMRAALRVPGNLLLGGILQVEAVETKAAAAAAGFAFERDDVEDGWWSGRFSVE